METKIDVRPQVAAGVAFLDEADPDWWKPGGPDAIDLDELDLGEPRSCILGQRCPAEVLRAYRAGQRRPTEGDLYFAQLEHLSHLTAADEAAKWASDHGFTVAIWVESGFRDVSQEALEGELPRFDALTAAWRTEIEKRRAAL
jgi:hypothetical protein